jgi:deazaflavin-dependent oxidoreductase (nitroreductase family)
MTEVKDAAYWLGINDSVVAEFRANAGKVGGDLEAFDVLLLTTTGAKSGQPRVTPLSYFTIDDKMIVAGSKAGADTHPDWVHNLRANPAAHIEVGADAFNVIARELPSAERDDAYPKIVARYPVFGEYEAKTSRVIPLFELQRA